MEKQSQVNWSTVAASIIGSTAAIGIGYLADAIIDALKESRLNHKNREYYEEMLKAHPALQKQDPKVVAQYWASLFHFAPYMAADPLSSGAFIRQSIDRGYPELYGGPPIDTYSTLTGIQKQVTDSKKSKGIFSEVASAAASDVVSKGLSAHYFPAPKKVYSAVDKGYFSLEPEEENKSTYRKKSVDK